MRPWPRIGLAAVLLLAGSGARAAAPADLAGSCWTGGSLLKALIKLKPRLQGFGAERVAGPVADELCFGPLPAQGAPARPELAAADFHLRLTDAANVSLVLTGTFAQDASGRTVFLPDPDALAALFEALIEEFAGGLPVALTTEAEDLQLDAKFTEGAHRERAKVRARITLVVSFEAGGRAYAITIKLRHAARLERAG